MAFSDDLKKLSFSDKYTTKEQKRKHARIPVEIPGSFIFKNIENDITEKCLINSVSTGGISIKSGMVLLKGDVIIVNFAIGDKLLSEYCKVTRAHGKEVGCKFMNTKKESNEIIQQFIYNKIFS